MFEMPTTAKTTTNQAETEQAPGLEKTTVTLEARDGTGFGASPCCGGPFRTHTSRCRDN